MSISCTRSGPTQAASAASAPPSLANLRVWMIGVVSSASAVKTWPTAGLGRQQQHHQHQLRTRALGQHEQWMQHHEHQLHKPWPNTGQWRKHHRRQKAASLHQLRNAPQWKQHHQHQLRKLLANTTNRCSIMSISFPSPGPTQGKGRSIISTSGPRRRNWAAS